MRHDTVTDAVAFLLSLLLLLFLLRLWWHDCYCSCSVHFSFTPIRTGCSCLYSAKRAASVKSSFVYLVSIWYSNVMNEWMNESFSNQHGKNLPIKMEQFCFLFIFMLNSVFIRLEFFSRTKTIRIWNFPVGNLFLYFLVYDESCRSFKHSIRNFTSNIIRLEAKLFQPFSQISSEITSHSNQLIGYKSKRT